MLRGLLTFNDDTHFFFWRNKLYVSELFMSTWIQDWASSWYLKKICLKVLMKSILFTSADSKLATVETQFVRVLNFGGFWFIFVSFSLDYSSFACVSFYPLLLSLLSICTRNFFTRFVRLFSDMNYPFHLSFYPSWVLSLLSSSRHGLYIYSGRCVLLVTFTFKSSSNFFQLTLFVALENGGCLRLSMRRPARKGYMAFQCYGC
jgi:hypothetical protein